MMTVAIPTKIEQDWLDGYHSTQIAYRTSNKLTQSGWYCKFCGKEPRQLFLTCGDSRYDDTVYMCDCKGAEGVGLDEFDCSGRFNSSNSPSYLKEGGSQFT